MDDRKFLRNVDVVLPVYTALCKTYLITYLITYLLTYLLTHLLTYLLSYLHTYLLTYLFALLCFSLLCFPLLCFVLLTYLLTPWSRVLLEKLTGSQLVKFPAFYGTRRFITMFKVAHRLSLF